MSRRNKMKLLGVFLLLALITICSVSFVVARSLSDSSSGNQELSSEKLQNLRRLFDTFNINAYLIPSNDAHQSEYVGEHDRRLSFMTEFTGSAGFAIVALDDAALWVDSRYHLQAERQVDQSFWTIMKVGVPGVQTKAEWLLAVLEKDSKVGFDPILLSSTEINGLNGSLTNNGHSLLPIEKNLVDEIWKSQPETNITPLKAHSIEYSGRNISDKVKAITDELEKLNAEAVFLTALDDIACTYNNFIV